MGPPFLNVNWTLSPGLTPGNDLALGLPNPIVTPGHFSSGKGPCEMVMPSGSTLSTLPVAANTPAAAAAVAGAAAVGGAGADAGAVATSPPAAMLPRTDFSRA